MAIGTDPGNRPTIDGDIFHKIVAEMDDGIIAIDASSTILFCNRSAEALFQASEGALVGKSLDVLLPPRFRQAHGHYLSEFRNGTTDARYMGSRRSFIIGMRADGTEINLGATILRTTGDNGPVFIAVVRDLTERLNYQSDLERLANTDPLSGLYNRRAFASLAGKELADCRQAGLPASLVLFDIDHFKSINDGYGHDVGDRVICEFAALLKPALHSKDVFARWGGEEFIVLMPNTSLDRSMAIAEMMRRNIEVLGFAGSAHDVRLTTSAGVVCCEDETETLEALIKRADKALYLAKTSGRNAVMTLAPDRGNGAAVPTTAG